MSVKNLEAVHVADHEITKHARDQLISERRVNELRSAVGQYTGDFEMPETHRADFLRVFHAKDARL